MRFAVGLVSSLLRVVAQLKCLAWLSLSPMGSGHANGLGGGEGVAAVDEGDADLDFCGLAVGGPCSDALAEGFEVECHRFKRTGGGFFASIRLLAWYPVPRFINARP